MAPAFCRRNYRHRTLVARPVGVRCQERVIPTVMNRFRKKDKPARNTPPFLTAMGRRHLPAEVKVADSIYRKQRVFKNDFFAVTALYCTDADSVILKVHRQAPLGFIPLRWVGRLLAAREAAAFELLTEVQGVPKLIARWGPTGVIREFVEGHPLARGERVSDDFHPMLQALIKTLHGHRMAYVDLEKCENVLVGDDGRPYLFDFQIAWHLSRRLGGELWPMRKLRTWLQNGDRYHLIKLQRRTRPDQLSVEQLAKSYNRPWYLRVHRTLTFPFTWCRRRVLDRIDPRRTPGERGTVNDDEAMGAL